MDTGNGRKILALILAAVLTLALISAAGADENHAQAKAAAVDYLKAAVAQKCPIQTYETDEPLIASGSYTYENAIAALALMSEGDYDSAVLILDALVTGMQQDAEFSDRFRNAYMVGSAADLPGYWNDAQGKWLQDAYQVGTSTKSSAAAAVALLTCHAAKPNDAYLNAAEDAVTWILWNCKDDNPGFTAGYTGWRKANAYTDLTYKTTVDNLWMAAACSMLAKETDLSRYSDGEASALEFVRRMFSSGDSRYCQGTAEDGIKPVADLIVTDVQALASLCVNDDAGLDNMEKCLATDGGYAYDNSFRDGSLLESTAIAALALKLAGDTGRAESALATMEKFQLTSGTFPQTSIPELKTGEKDVVFRDWPSVGPCAWFILAVNGANPFSQK